MSGPAAPSLHSAQLELPCRDSATTKAIAAAIALEVADGPDGSQVAIECKGPILHITVTAQRAATLRAALHSVLRLVDAAQRTLHSR